MEAANANHGAVPDEALALAACPFCGEDAAIVVQQSQPEADDQEALEWLAVACDICACLGPPDGTPEGAAARWNARAQ